jgi:hypothetical protein
MGKLNIDTGKDYSSWLMDSQDPIRWLPLLPLTYAGKDYSSWLMDSQDPIRWLPIHNKDI